MPLAPPLPGELGCSRWGRAGLSVCGCHMAVPHLRPVTHSGGSVASALCCFMRGAARLLPALESAGAMVGADCICGPFPSCLPCSLWDPHPQCLVCGSQVCVDVDQESSFVSCLPGNFFLAYRCPVAPAPLSLLHELTIRAP